ADEGIDADEQGELGQIGPQAEAEDRWPRLRCGCSAAHAPVASEPWAAAHSSGPPTTTATPVRPTRSSTLAAVAARSPWVHIAASPSPGRSAAAAASWPSS